MNTEKMLLINTIDFLIEQRESILLGYEKFIESAKREPMSETIYKITVRSYEDKLEKVDRLIALNKIIFNEGKL